MNLPVTSSHRWNDPVKAQKSPARSCSQAQDSCWNLWRGASACTARRLCTQRTKYPPWSRTSCSWSSLVPGTWGPTADFLSKSPPSAQAACLCQNPSTSWLHPGSAHSKAKCPCGWSQPYGSSRCPGRFVPCTGGSSTPQIHPALSSSTKSGWKGPHRRHSPSRCTWWTAEGNSCGCWWCTGISACRASPAPGRPFWPLDLR